MYSFFPTSVSRYFQPATYNRQPNPQQPVPYAQPSQYQQPQVQAFYQNPRQNFWTANSVGLNNQPTSWFNQLYRQTLQPFSTIWSLFNRYMPQQPTNHPYYPTNPYNPPAPPLPPTTPPTKPITADGWRLPSTDFRDLTTDQRMTLTGLSSAELGYLHVGGRGIAFTGSREGIYQSYWTVLEKLEKGEPVSERDKTAVLNARNQDRQMNLPAGTSFERNYLATLDKLTQSTHFTDKLRNAPPVQDTGKRLQVPSNINPASQQFIDFQKSVGNRNADFNTMMLLTNWNHDPLDNGIIDGSIALHELASNRANKALVTTPEGLQFAQSIAEHEMADGSINNTSSKFFVQAFDSAYSNGAVPKVSMSQIQQDTQLQAARSGRTLQDVKSLVTKTVDAFAKGTFSGVSQGLGSFADTMKNHPAMVAGQAGSMMLGAVCPYLAALPAMLGSRPSQRNFTAQGA
jgi:hypothetical protein